MKTEMRTPMRYKVGLILLGLVLTIVILEVGLRAAGSIVCFVQERGNAQSRDDDVRILCLGESTTAGGRDFSYPRQLEDILNAGQSNTQYAVINKGIIGTNTATIVSLLDENLERYRPDIVVTMMGVNDFRDDVLSFGRLSVFSWIKRLRVYKLLFLMYKHMRRTACDLLSRESGPLADVEYLIRTAQYAAAEKKLKETIARDPNSGEAHTLLGVVYMRQHWLGQGTVGWDYREKLFLTAIEMNSGDEYAYYCLGECYVNQKKYRKLKELLPEFLSLDFTQSQWLIPYVVKWDLVVSDGEVSTALILKNWDQKHCAFFFDLLAHVYEYRGKGALAEQCRVLAQEWRDAHYSVDRKRNYERLRDTVVLKHGLKLVCVQYPMRSVENLRRMVGEHERIYFVDNEACFKKHVAEEGFAAYFYDAFAGDFGHCRPKGNRLLAENVAEVILQQCS